MDEVSQERVDDAWDEGFAHGYSRGNEEGLKIAFKVGYDFGVKTVNAKFADEIERKYRIAIGLISTMPEFENQHPTEVMAHFDAIAAAEKAKEKE